MGKEPPEASSLGHQLFLHPKRRAKTPCTHVGLASIYPGPHVLYSPGQQSSALAPRSDVCIHGGMDRLSGSDAEGQSVSALPL